MEESFMLMQKLMGFLLSFKETVYCNRNISENVICGYIIVFYRPTHKLHKVLLTYLSVYPIHPLMPA